MSKYIISETQYQFLTETGSNSAAMDLDIYVQPVNYDTGTGNEDLVDSIESIIQNLQEISSSLKTGKKIAPELKNKIYQLDDFTKETIEQIKGSKFTNFNNRLS